MKSVYVVWHLNPLNDEKFLLTGIYSTEEKAQESIRRLIKKPGFKDNPKSFEICRYDLDKDEWTEGFISWDEA